MGEMNEKDLEQVAGGVESKTGRTITWRKKNCDVCTSECSAQLKVKMYKKALEYYEQGEEWVCPHNKK